EPAVERVVEDADVDERVDVLVRIRLVERERVLGRIGCELVEPRRALGQLLRGGGCGCRVASLGDVGIALDAEPRDLALIGRRERARERVLGEHRAGECEIAGGRVTTEPARDATDLAPYVHVEARDLPAL